MNSLAQAHHPKQAAQLPDWISTVMCIIFALLWGISMLPHTLFWRNTCYVAGACLGLYVIIKNMPLLRQKVAAPLWIILGLFAWVLFHYFFIGKNSAIGLEELLSIWKRAALGCIFAIGLGIAISSTARKLSWTIIAVGLLTPVLIYFVKYFFTFIAPALGYLAPHFLTLYYSGESSSFYIAKIAYVFFCLPTLAVALGMLAANIKSGGDTKKNCICAFVIIAVLGVFYLENIKNGFMFALFLFSLFFASLLSSGLRKISRLQWLFIGILVGSAGLFFNQNVQNNDSWRTLIADAKVASKIDQNDVWKYGRPELYPQNEFGKVVSVTNYERISWGIEAMRLIKENPLGYGAVLASFRHLTKEKWPDSSLTQSHSGWLDLTLGIGIPGVVLLIAATLLAIRNAKRLPLPWSVFGVWVLVSILILFTTTEVSQKVYVDTFVWLVAFVAALALPKSIQPKYVN